MKAQIEVMYMKRSKAIIEKIIAQVDLEDGSMEEK